MIISRFIFFKSKNKNICTKKIVFQKKSVTFAGSNYYQIIKKENYVRHCIKS
ncbi:Uncharacterised protein [Capnocytophaga ochracea]|uniref:Uncharacterized protein n=1 Tax=Capnocytophaga ochracea TaxID=1018 RepID=A0A2X2SY19_CAPOC|nr:Uncharacterised protein [Capnocytophaga ochracea]